MGKVITLLPSVLYIIICGFSISVYICSVWGWGLALACIYCTWLKGVNLCERTDTILNRVKPMQCVMKLFIHIILLSD